MEAGRNSLTLQGATKESDGEQGHGQEEVEPKSNNLLL